MPKVIKKRTPKGEFDQTGLRETVGDIRERIKERQRTLTYGLVISIVVAAVIIGVIAYQRASASKAQELAVEGMKAYYGQPSSPSQPPAERQRKALQLLKDSYGEKKNPAVLLTIADINYEMGNYDEAVKAAKELTTEYADPSIVSLGYYKLAMSYLRKNDSANALAALKSLGTVKDGALGDLALIERARILEQQGKAEEAKTAYQELITRFPRSTYIGEAQAKMGDKEGGKKE